MQCSADPAGVRLRFRAQGAGAAFHVYDRHALDQVPRRYVLAAGTELEDVWPAPMTCGCWAPTVSTAISPGALWPSRRGWRTTR
ncbi:DUF756 domain-containing protein [Sphingomonas sp. I4]